MPRLLGCGWHRSRILLSKTFGLDGRPIELAIDAAVRSENRIPQTDRGRDANRVRVLVIGEVLSLIFAVARSWFVPRSRLQAEMLILRHQLNVVRRSAIGRPRLTSGDRLLFVWLYRL